MAITCVDRISELPHPIQQQILSLLSQKDAVRICVLSKLWRHHWYTRPNVEFHQQSFNRQTFESLVNKTLQRYHDQNLSIHEFRLQVSTMYGSKPAAELLGKWIPKLKIFNIYLLPKKFSTINFDIPSSVFKAKSLQKICLERCTLNQNCVVDILFKRLKTLHLIEVDIADETLKKIISSCPLIESLTFHYCIGFKTIVVDEKLHNLKHFEFMTCGIESIELDVPSSVIERIKISYCPILLFSNDHRNLKCLSLNRVRLSNDFFSCDMPSLEFLELEFCYGFKEFHLSNRSIKHLVFHMEEPLVRATIDVPNILFFDFISFYLPSVFSFATTNSSHEWKSNVFLIIDDSSWVFLKLYDLLKDLSGSEISLKLFINTPLRTGQGRSQEGDERVPGGIWGVQKSLSHFLQNFRSFFWGVGQGPCSPHPPSLTGAGDVFLPCSNKKPVAVELLELWLPDENSMDSRSDFVVNQLFGICHPRTLVKKENSPFGICHDDVIASLERNEANLA